MNPRTVCFCQPIFSMISVMVAPSFRWSIATTCAALLPSRAPWVFTFALLRDLGAFLPAAVFFVVLPAFGAPSVEGARSLFFRLVLLAFGSIAFSCLSAAGAGLSVVSSEFVVFIIV